MLYPDFNLESINDMTIWGGPGIQEFILHLIRYSTTLTRLHAVDVYNMECFVNTIIKLSSISELTLSYGSGAIGHPGLTRLFKNYAAASDESRPSLKYIRLQHCPLISNVQLTALATIKSLRTIILRNLINVSTNGINTMINHLHQHEEIAYLELAEMDSINDNILVTLGNLKTFSCLKLENLKRITNQGVRGLAEKIDQSSALTHMTVVKCPKITLESIDYAKQKIYLVEHLN
ncbi:hypothetical protein BDA99DRAFT_529774 [Phascolomyces articulosus]|uniref:Uncharacterized protein n=1 Tax=Phascolomyces articulosus TaxID=60185 RepID=A0AAD5P6V4_9FUNG|nr:hypothetical protein BDA99DRAFT_529774 [Phascolomyces articulosus]